jgi:TolB protein
MRSARTLLAAALGALAWLGCTDDPAGPPGPSFIPPDSPELFLSDASAPGSPSVHTSTTGAGLVSVAYLSLPPGTISAAEFVIIRNLTAGDGDGLAVRVVNGGFDPVVILAEVGDRLEVEFHDDVGNVLERKYGTVPRSRPPSIVRVSPPEGRTDVALAVRPTVVFSEPVDPATLDAVRLLRGTDEVEGQVVTLPAKPWMVEIIPASLLAPQSEYSIDVGLGVRDLDGAALVAAARSAFTTGALAPPPSPPPGGPQTRRIAFVSSRHGGTWIYLANADGSEVVPLVDGYMPAWSWDGQMIAFTRGRELRVINADGSGERLVAFDAYNPSWSPDGTRLAYNEYFGGSINVIRLDGSGDEVLTRPETLGSYWGVGGPVWSPDGQSITFRAEWYERVGFPVVWVMSADGSNPRKLEGDGPGSDPFEANGESPSWSPDGSTLMFSSKRWDGETSDYLLASRRADGTGSLGTHFHSPPVGTISSPIYSVDWSPDGRSVVFDTWSDVMETESRIHVLDLESGIARQLIPEATGAGVVQPYQDFGVAWSRVTP